MQKKWTYLSGIFSNGDICDQLPEGVKIFDEIDSKFLQMMENVVYSPLIQSICAQAGLHDELKYLFKQLEICQKSLVDYLSSKR